MGWGIKKANKAINSIEPRKPNKVNFGTRGRMDEPNIDKVFNKPKQDIEGYDYKEADHSNKGSLRKEKSWKEANDIATNPKLSEAEKKFQLQQMINAERIHQNKFKPDTERKNFLRDKMLNKNQPDKLGESMEKYTDGSWRTRE